MSPVNHRQVGLQRILLASLIVISCGITGLGRRVDFPSAAFATVGTRAERGYFSVAPFDQVDMVNGSLKLSFVDLVLPGNAGMDLRITRTCADSCVNWYFSFTGAPLRIINPVAPSSGDWTPMLGMADGTSRPLHAGVVAGYFVTSDFSRYDATSRTLYLPNGWVATYEQSGNPGGGIMLVEVHDQYGNQITPDWDTSTVRPWKPESVTQTVSDAGATRTRTVEFAYDGNNPKLPSAITYEGRTWSYEYEALLGRLTSATPPEGPGWGYSSSGNLIVTTPSGGTAEYEIGFVMGHQDWQPVVRSITTGGRAVNGDTWDFEYGFSDSTQRTTNSATTPSGKRITWVHQLSSGPDGTDWTLKERTVTDGSTALSSMSRTYVSVPFVTGKPLSAIDVESISQDGVTFTTDFDYTTDTATFWNYLRATTVTETAGNHSTSRVRARTFDYDFTPYIAGKLASETVSIGGESFTSSYNYDSSGFMESATTLGITTTFGRDNFGNSASATDAHSHTTWTSHQWGVVSGVTTPAYGISRSINPDGSIASETRDGKTTAFAYDDLGRLTGATPSAGDAITTTYAGDGSSTTVTRGSSWVTTTVDGFGRVVFSENVSGVKVSTTYDAEGRKIFQSAPFTGLSGSGNSFAYDGLGRLTTVTHADLSNITYTYAGTDVSIKDENNHTTTQHWQMFGRPGGGRLASVTDADAQSWVYSYNALGSLTTVDGPGGPNRTWTYNTRNELVSETQPESGTTTYTYDSAGLMWTKTNARGHAFTYQHDGNHRLTAITAPVATESVSFEYNDWDSMTRMTTGALESLFDFDDANRLESRQDRINGRSFTTTYEYDTRSNVKKITYPSGRIVQYDHDAGNRTTKVYSGSTTYADDVSYHATGALAGMKFGNNRTETLTLNSRFRPEHLISGPLDVRYTYDGAGNVTGIDDARPGLDATFGYDTLDRLTSITGEGANSFAYDAQGNRTAKNGVTYTYSSTTNRLMSATSVFGPPESGTFTYDQAGNMEGDDVGTYTYATTGMMKTATLGGVTTAYEYDAAGARAVKSSGTGVRYYIRGLGSLLLAEYDVSTGTPVVAREYIYFGSRLLASFTETPPAPTVTTTVTAPSASAVIPADATVTIAADAAATGGASVSSVQFYANGRYVGADNSAPYAITWTPSVAGEYQLSARAVASTGKVANSPPVPVVVSALGRVLGVQLSPANPVQLQSTTVTVTGNAYACGAITVNFGDGSTPITHSHAGSLASSPLVLTHQWATTGAKTITATGHGDCLGVASTGTTIGGNDGPTVSLSAPAASSIHVTGEAVTLTATAADPQGIASVKFYSGLTLLYTDAAAPWSYAWTATEGSHVLTAKATDGLNAETTSASVSITVQDVGSIGVSANPVAGQAAVVTVYGAATDCGAVTVNYGDGDVVTYAVSGLPISNAHTWATGGTKTITATGQSTCSGSAETTVSVNAPPTVTLTSPANNDVFYAPATVSLTASASDSDGSIASVKFYAGGTLLATDTSAPYSYSWSGMANGSYAITAVATDNQGTTTTTAAIGISVGEPAASTVTGVSVSHSTVPVNTWVTVTVTGGNPCWAVSINFGDGNAPYLPIQDLPYQRTHYWTDPGTYTITATGQSFCTGQASVQITVTGEEAGSAAEPSVPQALPTPAFVPDLDDLALPLEGEPEGPGPTAVDSVPPVTYALLVDITAGASGTVTSSPLGMSCSGNDTTCSTSFNEGTSVTLTATPASGQTFLGWGGACSGTSTCVVSMMGDAVVTAAFASGSSATITYYHTDALGSVRATTNGSGTESAPRRDFLPFGETMSSVGGDPRQFLGTERDPETAFDAMGARYYRNVWGRFTSVDSIFTTAVTDPQRWNRYSYALNNPLRYVDPTGLDAEAAHDLGTDEGTLLISYFDDSVDGMAEFYYNASTSYDERAWKADGRRSVAAEEQRQKQKEKELAAYRNQIENILLVLGLYPLMSSYEWQERMLIGQFDNPDRVTKALSNDGRFRSGSLGFMHDVGPNPIDFRSIKGSLGPGSMQVVFSQTQGRFNVDYDKINPYQGVRGFIGHVVVDVLPTLVTPIGPPFVPSLLGIWR